MSRRLLAGWIALICAGLLVRATTVAAGGGQPPAAKDFFGTAKVWAIHLEISAKEYEAMQPPVTAFGPPSGRPPAPPPPPRGNRTSERNLFGTEFFWAE